jgi:hypothetical protein
MGFAIGLWFNFLPAFIHSFGYVECGEYASDAQKYTRLSKVGACSY